MASKHEILARVPNHRLLPYIDRWGLAVENRRVKSNVVGALARSRKAKLEVILGDLPRSTLQKICRELGLSDRGRAKSEFVDRILGRSPSVNGKSAELAVSFSASTARIVSANEAATRAPLSNAMTPTELSLSQLEAHLWEAANILRGSPVDRTDWKSYILPLLFFKRICDVWDEEYAEAVATYGEDFEDEHRFQVPEGCHWRDVRETASNVGKKLQNAMRGIEAANQQHLYGVFGDAQWTNKDRLPDDLLKDLVEHFSALPLGNKTVRNDVIGDAYEYLIKKFADTTNNKAGEFYTPRSVVRLMVEILDPKEGETVYDPACGTGGMLLAAVEHVREKGGDARTFFGKLFGQEKNLTTSSVARMNLLLHGVEDFQVERGDTLRNPVFKDPSTGGLATFDVVIANPPFSLDKWGRDVWESDPWGRTLAGLPPESNGDFAWVQHMLKSLARKGRGAVVLPIGATIRRGAEQDIRRHLIEQDLVDAVIGLAPDLFYGTVVEAVILVLRDAKPKRHEGNILFVDGSALARKGRSIVTLEAEHSGELLQLVRQRRSVPGRAGIATLSEVSDNDWRLAPKVFIDPQLAAQSIDLTDANRRFVRALADSRAADAAAGAALKALEGLR